ILDAFTKQILAEALVQGDTFSAALDFTEGTHRLLIRTHRANGNFADTPVAVTIDTTKPYMTSARFNTNDVTGIPESATLVFSEIVSWQQDSPPVFQLKSSDGTTYPIDNTALSFEISTLTLRVDLTAFASMWENDAFQIEMVTSAMTDMAGNEMLGGSALIGTAIGFPVFNTMTELPNVGGDSYSAPAFADTNGNGLLDLLIGEKTEEGTGKIRVYLNQGTADSPVYASWFYLQNVDGDITVPGTNCQGIIPRLADLTGNGLLDLVIGDGNGNVYVYYNQGTATSPVFGQQETLQYRNESGNPVAITVGSRASVELADINGNGRLDLLVGGMDGRIRLYLNVSTSDKPEFEYAGMLQCNGSDLVVPSGRASFSYYDMDGDGKRDLVSGDTEGRLWFYKNVGTDTEPVFDTPLQITVSGVAVDFDGQVRSRPTVVDYNSDGVPDIVVGIADGKLHYLQGNRDTNSFTAAYNQQREVFTVDFNVIKSIAQESPSTIVTTLDDVVDAYDGKISLREAIEYAGTDGLGATIAFASSLFGGTIILNGEELYIGKSITINATGAKITIDADQRSRVFNIASGSTVALAGLTITGGNADSGGGIRNSGILTVTNCTIYGNTAETGGAMDNNYTGTATLTNCTIAGNTAGFVCGGINNNGTLQLYNTIVAQNTGPNVENWDTGTITGTSNLLGSTIGCDDWANGNFAYDPIKPLFKDMVNGDYRLAINSQAIDKGDNRYAFERYLTHDLAGRRRIVGACIDIGAYEFDAFAIGGNLVVTNLGDHWPGVEDINNLSLREALLLAKDGQVITFDPTLFMDGERTLLLAGGELKITSSVTIIGIIDGVGNSLLTIDANKKSRIMSVTTKTGIIDVTLENITLTGGNASNIGVSQGGAMYVKNANLTLTNMTFTNNNASYGGAVFLMNSEVNITNVTMQNNTGNWGGAIYYTGGEYGRLEINSSTFESNTGQRGGAIYQSDGSLWLEDVMLIENESTWGGGLYQAGGTAILNNTEFTGNHARNRFGNAIVKSKGATLTINKSGAKPITHGDILSMYLDENDLEVDGM
ncbi:MAG: FG-GAP-like repeat-containing protein, partial [Planctomycetaceae bacterium]|nr:FG-GAP-like repeat-containing protein [Planctomycetaceae bacterium]